MPPDPTSSESMPSTPASGELLPPSASGNQSIVPTSGSMAFGVQPDPTTSAIEQIKLLKSECLGLLTELKQFSPPDPNGRFQDSFRLIATPMLYSAWERCFTLCHAIGFRLLREECVRCDALNPSQRVVWLLRTSFYSSFSAHVRNLGSGGQAKRNSTRYTYFKNASQFIAEFDKWAQSSLDKTVDTEDLVMTASNVNKEIVELNAQAFGIADYPPFMRLKLDHLDELVSRRNDVGHGATLKGPSNPDFIRLWDFTEQLLGDYCDTFIAYIQEKYPTT